MSLVTRLRDAPQDLFEHFAQTEPDETVNFYFGPDR
jgi:hypothetical protein